MEIIHQDENIIAVNKPAGLKVYGTKSEDSLTNRLTVTFPELTSVGSRPRYGLIHRLDKETSGVILIARNQDTLAFCQKQFQNRKVNKTYLGLIHGEIKPKQGAITSNLQRSPKDFRKQKASPVISPEPGRAAETAYRIKKLFPNYTLLEIEPKTGRIHQIRAQLAWKGHPIAGDRLYQFKDQAGPACLQRMFLHSWSIRIAMPNQEIKTFQAPLPEELNRVLDCLKEK